LKLPSVSTEITNLISVPGPFIQQLPWIYKGAGVIVSRFNEKVGENEFDLTE
jgi:hypothetical protein